MITNLLFMMPGGFELLILLIPLGIWVWTIMDCLRSEFTDYNKFIWLGLLIFVPIVGVILYFAFGRSQRIMR